MTLEEALTDTIRATRRYAKRQLTWFRRESGVRWFSAEDLRQCCRQVSALVNELGLGGNHGQG
jgi:tRNA dimethylallyltransferase